MNASLAFWTFALADLLGVVACALAGVRCIRRGDVDGHRRRMLLAASGVGLFLASYLIKLVFLGREPLDTWDATSLLALYLHETCIAVMLLSGALAGRRAWRFRHTRGLEPAARRSRDRVVHRRYGRVAVGASALAFAWACVMLFGMYARAG